MNSLLALDFEQSGKYWQANSCVKMQLITFSFDSLIIGPDDILLSLQQKKFYRQQNIFLRQQNISLKASIKYHLALVFFVICKFNFFCFLFKDVKLRFTLFCNSLRKKGLLLYIKRL